jgi:hypothetical protein
MIEHDDRRCSTALVEVNASQRGHTGKIARLKQPRSSGAYRPRRHPDDAFASPGAEIDWSCEDQADWSKRVDVAVGGGSGVSHKLYEKTPRKGLAENPWKRTILDAQFRVLKID